MGTARGGTATPVAGEGSVADRLFAEGYAFDFFQAVRLLERLAPQRRPVGRAGPPPSEIVRFRAHLSLSFPPSSLYEVQPPTTALPVPAMIVSFLGLTGPSGILPRHYTEMLLRLERESKGPEKNALRAWLDLFNHRLISLFYRAWEKYRFYVAYERGDYAGREPDSFTQALLSLVGLGLPALRHRLHFSVPDKTEPTWQRVLARIDDLSLLHYSGYFAHRPRCAVALEALLCDYFGLPIRVRQFHGQWLLLDEANQSRIGVVGGQCELGVNLVAGDRVWDVQSKIRIVLGPLSHAEFDEFLPDRAPTRSRKAFFLLCHLVRLYVGPTLDFDVQLILKAEDVPACQITEDAATAARLGWNTWSLSGALPHDADDAVFSE